MSPPEPQQYLTIADVMWRLNVSRRTVERMISDGRLRAAHAGTAVRISPDAFAELEERLHTAAGLASGGA